MLTLNLADLAPEFIKEVTSDGVDHQVVVGTLAEATGLRFDCPICHMFGTYSTNHPVIVWRSEYPFSGTNLTDIDMIESVLVTSRYHTHYFVSIVSGVLNCSFGH